MLPEELIVYEFDILVVVLDEATHRYRFVRQHLEAGCISHVKRNQCAVCYRTAITTTGEITNGRGQPKNGKRGPPHSTDVLNRL